MSKAKLMPKDLNLDKSLWKLAFQTSIGATLTQLGTTFAGIAKIILRPLV